MNTIIFYQGACIGVIIGAIAGIIITSLVFRYVNGCPVYSEDVFQHETKTYK